MWLQINVVRPMKSWFYRSRLLSGAVVKYRQLTNMIMYQLDRVMPVIKKIVKAAELPADWARDFTNPDQLVVVTISDTDQSATLAGQHRLGGEINLAAPSDSDKAALQAMPLSQQKQMYESAILRAAAQDGCKVSKADIITGALKTSRNG